MDSITQAVLGAAVGEAVLGKKIGNKAPLWGIIGGTLPDLDVLLNPFLSDVESLVMHRTFTHSIFILTLFTPIIAYFVFAFYKKRTSDQPYAGFIQWCYLFFMVFLTHILLDAFTNYGTMILYPFYDHRFAWNTIFVIDPLYTLPLVISVLMIFYKKRVNARRFWNRVGLILSTGYLMFTCFNKLYIDNKVVKTSLSRQGINYESFMTVPTPFNNILWSVIVKSKEGFHTGYYSLLDGKAEVSFNYFDQNKDDLNSFIKRNDQVAHEIKKLKTFSKGYYVVESDPGNEELIFNDIRFGNISGWMEGKKDFIFAFRINLEEHGWRITRDDLSQGPTMEDFNRLVVRMMGKKTG